MNSYDKQGMKATALFYTRAQVLGSLILRSKGKPIKQTIIQAQLA